MREEEHGGRSVRRSPAEDDDLGLYSRSLGIHGVTRRQAEVARLLSWHHTNVEMAELLGISVSAVKAHLERIFHKLRVGDRRAASVKVRRIVREYRDSPTRSRDL